MLSSFNIFIVNEVTFLLLSIFLKYIFLFCKFINMPANILYYFLSIIYLTV